MLGMVKERNGLDEKVMRNVKYLGEKMIGGGLDMKGRESGMWGVMLYDGKV